MLLMMQEKLKLPMLVVWYCKTAFYLVHFWMGANQHAAKCNKKKQPTNTRLAYTLDSDGPLSISIPLTVIKMINVKAASKQFNHC